MLVRHDLATQSKTSGQKIVRLPDSSGSAFLHWLPGQNLPLISITSKNILVSASYSFVCYIKNSCITSEAIGY